jgi:hypothetical protein
MTEEWLEWHRGYTDGSPLSRRLGVVQDRIREILSARRPGPIAILSMCAGDGRDLLGALAEHPRRHDVRARLVELSPELVESGRGMASQLGLPDVQFVVGDAGWAGVYGGAAPADLILVCGVFGNVSDRDVRGTIGHLPELLAPGGVAIWTRGRFPPDLTPEIRRWFDDAGFTELSFVPIPDSTASVGTHRLTAAPRPLRPEVRLFRFLPRAERPSNRTAEPSTRAEGGSP